MNTHFISGMIYILALAERQFVSSPKAAVNIFVSEYNLHIKFAFLWPGVVMENKVIKMEKMKDYYSIIQVS